MKKPHEQEWKWYESGNSNFGVSLAGVLKGGFKQETIGSRMKHENAMFIAAAPDMARALLAFVDAADNGLPTDLPRLDHGARMALRKAGVLP